MKRKTMTWWLGVAALVLAAQSTAAGGLAVNYVKTLGQTNVKGMPFRTAGGRISVDKHGNLYLCGMVNAPWNALIKLAPDGRVIWESPCSGYNATATAVDEDYVYVVAPKLLRRFTKAGGKMDSTWGFENTAWGGGMAEPGIGFPSLSSPKALIASGSHLYVVDSGRDELLRLEKATGKEHPFNSRLMVVAPVDIANAKNGNLLLLTGESVFEIDAEGNPGKGPIIDGFAGAAAIDVDPVEGKIYIAIGGADGDLVNTINEYTADGKPTGVKIGRGGEFSGMWAPDQFAFAAGLNDIAIDPAGGLWVSNAGRGVLPTLVHFDRSRRQDGLVMGVNAQGLAVCPDLSVIAGGTCKISWDNRPLWTSGLVTFGDQKQYPALGPENWTYRAAYADASIAVIFGYGSWTVHSQSSSTGALLHGPYPVAPATEFCSAGKAVFYVKDGVVERLDVAALDKPQSFFRPPEGVKIDNRGLAVSEDLHRVCLCEGDKVVGYRTDGAKLWAVAARPPMTMMKNTLWATPAAGIGVLALDAMTGQSLGVFGEKESGGRLPLTPTCLAVGSKDGNTYLFVGGNSQIQVFEATGP